MKAPSFGKRLSTLLSPSINTHVAEDKQTPFPVELFDRADFSAEKVENIFFEALDKCKTTKEKMEVFLQLQVFVAQIEANHKGMKEQWVEDARKLIVDHDISGRVFDGNMKKFYLRIGQQEQWIKKLRRFEEVVWNPLWQKTQEEGGVMDHLAQRFSKYW